MTRRPTRTSVAPPEYVSRGEQETRWIAAWNEVYELEARAPGVDCLLPDGSVVDCDAGRAWLQQRAYEQHALHVALRQERGRARIVLTSTAPG